MKRTCKKCDTVLVKKKFESVKSFEKRIYCSNDCYRSCRLENLSYKDRSTAHYHARRIKGSGCCEKCGSESSVDVHHIDENPFNNELSNLKRLCRACHETHHRKRSCTVLGCDRKHKGRGYCSLHYQRWKTHGDPSVTLNGR